MNEVSEYVMWDPHETPKDTEDYLRDVEEQWEERTQATYAIFSRDDRDEVGSARPARSERRGRSGAGCVAADPNERRSRDDGGVLAGTTNLHFDWDRRSAELGIWLRKPFWGRGYSGERAAAMLELAFDRLDLELVGASHQDGNEKSRRAIEKYVERFGGQYDGLLRNFVPEGDEVRDLHRYTISREQYREATERD